MSYTILLSSEAHKDIKRLDTVIKKRLQKKLMEVSQAKDITTLSKRLINHDAGDYRIRIGDYRIIFDLDGNEIFILRVRHRREVYR
jgi:mRNA interferase RelE/StbE